MTKHTFPNQPDEMPSINPRPKIERPGDPSEPGIPQEAPDRIPQEIPEERPSPEIKPDEPPLQGDVK